jgi:hypothetical protein
VLTSRRHVVHDLLIGGGGVWGFGQKMDVDTSRCII